MLRFLEQVPYSTKWPSDNHKSPKCIDIQPVRMGSGARGLWRRRRRRGRLHRPAPAYLDRECFAGTEPASGPCTIAASRAIACTNSAGTGTVACRTPVLHGRQRSNAGFGRNTAKRRNHGGHVRNRFGWCDATCWYDPVAGRNTFDRQRSSQRSCRCGVHLCRTRHLTEACVWQTEACLYSRRQHEPQDSHIGPGRFRAAQDQVSGP